MTLEEKISQVHADSKFSTAAIPRLGIPRRWIDDGPHGVREDVGPYRGGPPGTRTIMPPSMPALSALASTWNLDLATAFGNVLGQESRSAGQGHHSRADCGHRAHPALRPDLRILRRRPVPERAHGGELHRRRAIQRRGGLHETFCRQQPGGRAGPRSTWTWTNARCAKFTCRRSRPPSRRPASGRSWARTPNSAASIAPTAII